MKFRKILPLVLVAPLLASCGGIKVEEPSFEAYSNKVDHAAYAVALTAALADAPMAKADKLGSFEAKSVSSASEKVDFGGEKALKTDIKSRTEKEIKFDSVNLLVNNKSESSYEEVEVTGPSSETQSSHQKSEGAMQCEEVEGVKKAVSVDLVAKEYSLGDFSGEYADYLDAGMKSSITTDLPVGDLMVAEFDSFTDEEKAKYSFYQDDKLFTVVYESSEEEKYFDAFDESKELGTAKGKVVNKYQINLSAGKLRAASSSVSETSLEFTAEGKIYIGLLLEVKAGDKAESKIEEYKEANIEFKDVSLEKQDLAKFVKLGD